MLLQEISSALLDGDIPVRHLVGIGEFETLKVSGRCIIVLVGKEYSDEKIATSVSYLSNSIGDFSVNLTCKEEELNIKVDYINTHPFSTQRLRNIILNYKRPLNHPNKESYQHCQIPVFLIKKEKIKRVICTAKADVRLFNLDQPMLLAETSTGAELLVDGRVSEYIGVISKAVSEFRLYTKTYPKFCMAQSLGSSHIQIGATENATLRCQGEGKIRFKGSIHVADYQEDESDFIQFNLRDVFAG